MGDDPPAAVFGEIIEPQLRQIDDNAAPFRSRQHVLRGQYDFGTFAGEPGIDRRVGPPERFETDVVGPRQGNECIFETS
jgi:hypothetical protein